MPVQGLGGCAVFGEGVSYAGCWPPLARTSCQRSGLGPGLGDLSNEARLLLADHTTHEPFATCRQSG
jgi:hypothetical protein